jgi:hypothetical protein
MNLALEALEIYVPPGLKKRLLRELYRATAQALSQSPPHLGRLSYRDLLESYAVFTKNEAIKLLDGRGPVDAAKDRLYRNAFALGERLRKRLRPRSTREVFVLSRILYGILGISFEGGEDEVIIRRCYFSPFYTADVCRLVSAIDAGVAAGLSGGGRLEFSQRITDGADCCRARLVLEGSGK